VSNIKLTVNEATKHTVPECVEETPKRLVQPLVNRMNVMEEASILFEVFLISLSFSLSFFSKNSLVFILPDD
jgi:hypothetical protein